MATETRRKTREKMKKRNFAKRHRENEDIQERRRKNERKK